MNDMEQNLQFANPQGFLEIATRQDKRVKNQAVTSHNMDTHKVFCLEPLTIVNPQLTDFVLTRGVVYFFDSTGLHTFTLPLVHKNVATSEYRKILTSRINKMVRRSQVHSFFDGDGVAIDTHIQVPCGHCLLCTERKRTSFAARCAMECQMHDMLPLFITLTYAPEHLPSKGVTTRDVQLFLKRIRINLERNYGFKGQLRFAAGSEYGKDNTYRPHYHLLLWNFPRYGHFKHAGNVHKFLIEQWDKGIVDLKFCKNTKAGLYVGKYMSKDEKVPFGKNKTRHWTSKNLGVQFVMDTANKLLHESPECSRLQYRDRFSGAIQTLPLVKYFIKKIFPTYTSIPVEVRDSVRDLQIAKGFSEYRPFIDALPEADSMYEYFIDEYTEKDFDKSVVAHAIDVIKRFRTPDVDYKMNQVLKERYYVNLFDNLGDNDLNHIAYVYEKKNAIKKDKEVF